MSIENTKDINGRTYSVGKLPASEAVRVQVALVNLCGDALFKAAASSNGDQEAAGSAALQALSNSLDAEKVLSTMKTVMVQRVSIDGKRIMNLDEAFADHVEDMWPAFFFALQVNFANFFKGGLFASAKKKIEGLSQSNPQTSTGTSADQ